MALSKQQYIRHVVCFTPFSPIAAMGNECSLSVEHVLNRKTRLHRVTTMMKGRFRDAGSVLSGLKLSRHFPQCLDTRFSDYVKTFLQYKQEASGHPEHAVSEVDKRAYIDDYFEREY